MNNRNKSRKCSYFQTSVFVFANCLTSLVAWKGENEGRREEFIFISGDEEGLGA